MGLVLSFVDARARKVKATLGAFASSRTPAMVGTADSLIDARRIFCRDAVAVLIDRYGCQSRIGYTEITRVDAALPAARIVITHHEAVEEQPGPEFANVVRFPAQHS